MLSYQEICFSHPGQKDRGRTTERSRGNRKMHTFRKLPISNPARKASTASSTCSRSLPARRHEPGLSVFHEIVERRHVSNRQPLDSVQEPRLQDVGPEEGPGRFQDKTSPGHLF